MTGLYMRAAASLTIPDASLEQSPAATEPPRGAVNGFSGDDRPALSLLLESRRRALVWATRGNLGTIVGRRSNETVDDQNVDGRTR